MRVYVLYIVIVLLVAYAWKDWFKVLLSLILMMAVIKHGDMPTNMFGIQGFNMWNILFIGIFLAWLASRRREGLMWDMPRHMNVLLLMYLGVILIGFLRAVFDRAYIENYSVKSLVSDELINTVKWVLPGILLFDGCRTRKKVVLAIGVICCLYFLIALQVVYRVPWACALSAASQGLAHTRTKRCAYIGYTACDISTFLAGASWAILATIPLVRRKKYLVMVLLAAAGIIAFGQALTGGRAGFMAWGATGLMLCLLKWRKYLVLAPVVVILLPTIFPGAVERMLTGFGVTDVAGQSTIDVYSMTSGRTLIWPHVIDKITESPLLGYGRLAMRRTGIYDYTAIELNEAFAQPHNMYLETLLDNGILGSLLIFLFWGTVVSYSAKLFRSNNRLCSAVGGLALSMILAQLFAGVGSQHFYPEESTLGVWAAMFLSLRVYLEWARAQKGMISAERSWNGQLLQQQQAAITSVYAHGITTR